MSFKSILKVGGKEMNVLGSHYELDQETAVTGKPSSVVRGGKIDVTFETNGDSFFFEWMTDSFDRKDGSLVFLRPDSEAKMTEIFFKDAYLVNFSQSFSHNGKTPLTESIIISARVMSWGGGELENEWADN